MCQAMNSVVHSTPCRPIGFIVEGEGEFGTYERLIYKIIGTSNCSLRLSNAGGAGNIVRHLDRELGYLVKTYHPCLVFVTIDLKDVIKQGVCSCCRELHTLLKEKIDNWSASVAGNPAFQPSPEAITIIIQIQAYETWLIADVNGLCSGNCLTAPEPQPASVDHAIAEPCTWLHERLVTGLNTKKPAHMKKLFSLVDPHIMRNNSSSFDKFFREVNSAYTWWCSKYGT